MSTFTDAPSNNAFSGIEIQAQLQKIFVCPAFSVSDILRRFLSYITKETLAGRSNTIKEYTIALNVLNKPISFKPQQDAIVRIHAGRLRRALNSYYKEAGADDRIEISVPKGSYIPVFAVRNQEHPEKENDRMPLEPGRAKDLTTLVVMPFQTFETSASRRAFADNLGRQLSAEFGRFPGFALLSYYAGRQMSSINKQENGQNSDLITRFIITGSVQFEARRLRVAIELTDVQKGTQIWSESYHRTYSPSNLFEIGDQIISAVAGILGDFNGIIVQELSRSITKSAKPDTLCHPIFWYRFFYYELTEDAFKSTYSALEAYVNKTNPNEVAYALLGDLSLLAVLFDQSTAENPLILGLRNARLALKTNPNCQCAYITLAMSHIFLNNREACVEALFRALELNPHAAGMTGMIGCLFIATGEYQQGIQCIRQSINRNNSYPAFFKLFISLYHFRQSEFALAYSIVSEIELTEMQGFNILLRASILSHMARKTEAELLMKTWRGQSSYKSRISKDFLHRFLLDADLVEKLLEGINISKIRFLTVA